jgi:hypothetical protein
MTSEDFYDDTDVIVVKNPDGSVSQAHTQGYTFPKRAALPSPPSNATLIFNDTLIDDPFYTYEKHEIPFSFVLACCMIMDFLNCTIETGLVKNLVHKISGPLMAYNFLLWAIYSLYLIFYGTAFYALISQKLKAMELFGNMCILVMTIDSLGIFIEDTMPVFLVRFTLLLYSRFLHELLMLDQYGGFYI